MKRSKTGENKERNFKEHQRTQIRRIKEKSYELGVNPNSGENKKRGEAGSPTCHQHCAVAAPGSIAGLPSPRKRPKSKDCGSVHEPGATVRPCKKSARISTRLCARALNARGKEKNNWERRFRNFRFFRSQTKSTAKEVYRGRPGRFL